VIEADVIEQVLEGFEPAAKPIRANYPSHRLEPPRVGAFVDRLVDEARNDPRLTKTK
jgi:hypothetical protein